jgi:hypothetical protein
MEPDDAAISYINDFKYNFHSRLHHAEADNTYVIKYHLKITRYILNGTKSTMLLEIKLFSYHLATVFKNNKQPEPVCRSTNPGIRLLVSGCL